MTSRGALHASRWDAYRWYPACAAVLLAVSLAACVGDKTTDSATGTGTTGTSSGAGSGTVGMSTSSVSATGLDDTGVPTTGVPQPGTTEAGTTTEVGTTGGSTTGGAGTIEGACGDACMVFLECMPGTYPDLKACVDECVAGAAGGPKCEAAAIEFNSCIGGFDCAQLADALQNEQFGACTDVFMAYVQQCNP